MMNVVKANMMSCELDNELPKKPRLRSVGSAKNVLKKFRICSMRSDIKSSMPN